MLYKYLIEGNKIIRGPIDLTLEFIPDKNQEIKEIEIDKDNPPNWTINENGKFKGFSRKELLKWDKKLNHPVFKTDKEIEIEENKKTKKNILKKLMPLISAMNFQNLGIEHGGDPSKTMFTSKQIKEISEYIGEISNGNISAKMPELPEFYQKLMK